MDFAIERGGTRDLPVLVVTGEIDLSNAHFVFAEAQALSECETVVVDFREVAYIDSTGFRMMLEVNDEGHERGRRTVFLVNGHGAVRRVLDLVDGAELVEIRESYEGV